MKFSLIIPCRSNIPQQLKDSIDKQIVKPDEIIEVIGNALTVQRNEGIKRASGDIIVFVDDDIVLEEHYFMEIYNIFSYYGKCMALTGNVQTPVYKPNMFWNIFAHIFMLTYRAKGKFQVSGFPQNYHSKIINRVKGEMLYGCGMAFRKEIFKEYSFCEDLDSRMYGEDDYFAWLITRKYEVMYSPFLISYDFRPYPQGKQAHKIRCTFINLIKRMYSRKPNLLGKISFWWAMLGFIIFKLVEAIVMKDFSIIQGMINCFKSYNDKPLEDIRNEIKINIYDNQWRKINV